MSWLHHNLAIWRRGCFGVVLSVLSPMRAQCICTHCHLQTVCILNPLHANFLRGNKNIYLRFVSFLHCDMTQVAEILPQVRKELTYSRLSISWVLRHQQSRYELYQFSPRTLKVTPPPPSVVAYMPMRRWTESTLVQVITCRLFGAKPLPESVLACCQLDS